MADGWSELLRELGVHHKRELRNRYVCSDDTSDIIMFDSDLGLNVELDIFLAHPWSKSVLAKAARNEGAAASKREDEKASKYAAEQFPGGGRPNCISLVDEHFGHWGVEAESFLKRLSKRDKLSKWCNDDRDFRDFINHWRKQYKSHPQEAESSHRGNCNRSR